MAFYGYIILEEGCEMLTGVTLIYCMSLSTIHFTVLTVSPTSLCRGLSEMNVTSNIVFIMQLRYCFDLLNAMLLHSPKNVILTHLSLIADC